MDGFLMWSLSGPILYMGYQHFMQKKRGDVEHAKFIDAKRLSRIHTIKPDDPIPYAVMRFAMDKAQSLDPFMFALVLSSSCSIYHFFNGLLLRFLPIIILTLQVKKWQDPVLQDVKDAEVAVQAGHQTVADILLADDPTYRSSSPLLVYKYQYELVLTFFCMALVCWWHRGFNLFFRLMRVSWQWICVGFSVTNMRKRWILSGLFGILFGTLSLPFFTVRAVWAFYMFLNFRHGNEDNVVMLVGGTLITFLSGYCDSFAISTYGVLTKKFLVVPNPDHKKVLVLRIYDVVYRRSLVDIAQTAGRGAKTVNEFAEQRFWAESTVTRAEVVKELNAEPSAESLDDGLKKWALLTNKTTGLGIGTDAVYSCKFELDYEDV